MGGCRYLRQQKIPKSTISDKKDDVIIEKQKKRPSTTLTNDEEESLVLYIQEAQSRLRKEKRSIKSKKNHLSLIIKGNQLNWCPITGAMTTLE